MPLGEELRLLDLLPEDAVGLGERLPVAAEVRLEPRAEEPRPHPLLGAAARLRPFGGQAARLAHVAVVQLRHRSEAPPSQLSRGVVGLHQPLRRRLGLRPPVAQGVRDEAPGLDLPQAVGVARRRLVEGGERLVDVGPAPSSKKAMFS